uniref:NACHT LRR and PYD domain-containing protein n=1 Tax=Latimeria chalumnae TaxID=7897 RepID=H3ABP0_LATCH
RLNRCELTTGCSEGLPSLLHTSQTLRELDLSYSKLGNPELRFLSDGLKDTNSTVQTLQLNNCYLTSASCEALSSFLSRNQSLIELNLDNNPIKDAGMRLICNVSNNQLQKLSSNNCYLTSICCEVLSSFLSRNQSLTELNLSNNPIRDAGMSLICNSSCKWFCNLGLLILNSCSLTSGCCEALCSFLKQNQSLRDLDLSFNKIEDLGMSEICKADNNQLQKLSLNSCSLTSGCCEALCSFLKQNQSLRELDLASNKIKDSGLSEICKADNNQLQKLSKFSLRKIRIFAFQVCFYSISSAYRFNRGFKAIHLFMAKLPGAYIEILCNVNIFYLWGCGLTDRCCKDLASVLHTNQTLTELNLGWNALLDSGVREICAALKDPNCKLQTL